MNINVLVGITQLNLGPLNDFNIKLIKSERPQERRTETVCVCVCVCVCVRMHAHVHVCMCAYMEYNI
jgi:hypothetical protein